MRKTSTLLLALTFGYLIPAHGRADTGLFTPVDARNQDGFEETSNPALRSRDVALDPQRITAIEAAQAQSLVLNLFPDATFTARLDQAGRLESGGHYWTGRLEEISSGTVSLVIRDGALTGTVNTGESLFLIRPDRGGLHIVREVDPATYAPEIEPIDVVRSGADYPESFEAADDGSNIDIVVAYTPTARDKAGGTTAVENLIDLAVVETNQSYSNSGVNQRLTLKGTQQVAYSEAGFNWSTTLSRFAGTSDGYMDSVHTLRDAVCADAVVLIVGDTGYCGIAFLMSNVSSTFASSAFSVVSYTCATGYYSFGHELGHNMGARHDWYVDDSKTPWAHSHGFVNPPDRWRTVMAYNSECSASGFNCSRLQYWSNPLVSYGGDPMGVAAGTKTNCTEGNGAPGCDADNHLTLDKTALTFANFRDSDLCVSAESIFTDGFESGDTSGWSSTSPDTTP